jgi:WhiB family redox-sensing transcriptional regulator
MSSSGDLVGRPALLPWADGARSVVEEILDLLAGPKWFEQAACRGRSDVNFFPAAGDPVEPALELCAGCSVSSECLEMARRTGSSGIWGGMTGRRRGRRRGGWELPTLSETAGSQGEAA